jgi:ribosome recycling factor
LDKLAKAGDAGEDDVHRAENDLDDFTHKHVAKIDELLEHKKAELLEV